MSLKTFQINTVEHAYRCLNSKENARFLVADEVGLGKTIVAREVVKKFLENDDKTEFTVVYICNNQLLAKKNLKKLKPAVEGWGFETPHINRLSLFPLEKYRDTSDKKTEKQKTCYFYALTPGTSFSITNGYGIAGERKLLYLLDGEPEADIEKYEKVDSWAFWNFSDLNIDKLKTDLKEKEQIFKDPLACKEEIPARRQALSRFGASLLKPDLVIFDEFQNYEQILFPDANRAVNEDENAQAFQKEIDIINSVFAKADPAPKYLLLSATPFAPLTMNDELARGEVNLSSCDAFSKLIEWLRNDSMNNFKKEWADYADLFKEYCQDLKKENHSDLEQDVKDKRNAVQDIIRNVMSRSERPQNLLTGLVSPIDQKTSVLSAKDLTKTALFSGEDKLAEYEKYAYKPLSFMGDNYVTFNQFATPGYFLGSIDEAMNSPYMQKLLDVMGKGNKLRPLFWMPPTCPTLNLCGDFKNAFDDGFSKVLIFSKFCFIPRMISAGLSAKFERDFYSNDSEYKFFSDSSHELRENVKNLLLPEWEKYDPEEIFRSPAKSVYWAFKKLIKGEPEEDILKRCRIWSVLIASVLVRYMLSSHNMGCLKAVVGPQNTREDYAAEYCRKGCFADVAYEYMYLVSKEQYGDFDDKKIDAIGSQFFRTLRLRTNNLKLYFNRETNPVADKFVEKHSKKVRTHFADCFSEKEKTEGQPDDKNSSNWDTQLKTLSDILKQVMPEDGVVDLNKLLPKESPDRNKELQTAFNSPFKPFVLSTTSIGQEGLDFHWYCRKIMHWNLPSNPVDFDQREGRINRFCSYALRQTLAAAYHPENEFNWDDFWSYWETSENSAGLVPHWLPPVDIKNTSRKIERIVPFYPLSREHLFMDDLLKMQAVYRMVIGQPHQDELLSLLRDLSPEAREKIMACTISLQPPAVS